MKPVDAHCHLNFEQYNGDREELIKRSKEKLEFVAVPGVNRENNTEVLELQREHPDFVAANLGLHPTYTDSFEEVEEIKEQIRDEDPAAIGEIGLDHHHVTDEEERKQQEKVFREFLKLAEELGKPVVVHSREAEGEAVDIISEYELPEVMLHCFNGSPELAEKAVEEHGMKIGVTTQVLYSSRVQSIVEEISVEDMLLETDSPYLYRGERNKPVNVLESAEKVSDIKGVSREKVVQETTRNAELVHRYN